MMPVVSIVFLACARFFNSSGSSSRLKSCGGSAGHVMHFHGPRRIIIVGAIVPSPQYSAKTVSCSVAFVVEVAVTCRPLVDKGSI